MVLAGIQTHNLSIWRLLTNHTINFSRKYNFIRFSTDFIAIAQIRLFQ